MSKSLCTGVSRVGKGVEEVHWPRDELLLEAEVCHQKGHCIAGKIKSAKYMWNHFEKNAMQKTVSEVDGFINIGALH